MARIFLIVAPVLNLFILTIINRNSCCCLQYKLNKYGNESRDDFG